MVVMGAGPHMTDATHMQVRVWPAWKCLVLPCICSHPGTPTHPHDRRRAHEDGTDAGASLARLEMLSLPLYAIISRHTNPLSVADAGASLARLEMLSLPLHALISRHINPLSVADAGATLARLEMRRVNGVCQHRHITHPYSHTPPQVAQQVTALKQELGAAAPLFLWKTINPGHYDCDAAPSGGC